MNSTLAALTLAFAFWSFFLFTLSPPPALMVAPLFLLLVFWIVVWMW